MELNNKNIKKILLTVALSAITVVLIVRYNIVLDGIAWILSVLSPFITGFCIFFVLNVLMRCVENKWDKIFSKKQSRIIKKIKRAACMIISFLIVILIICVLVFLIFPEIRKTIEQISGILPVYMEKLEFKWNEIAESVKYTEIPKLEIEWENVVSTVISFLTTGGKSIFSKTVGVTSSIVGGFVNFALGFVFSIYILYGKEKLGCQIKKLTYAFIPRKAADYLTNIAVISNRVFTKFVTGQLTEACIIALLCFVGMNIFRMPYATMISTIIGITALIPVFGAFIGTAVGAFFILMVSPLKAVWFVIFILVLQQLEGDIIYPKVVGKSVGLPGIWVLAAVTIGAEISGVTGMLVAVPLCSVAYTVLADEVNRRSQRFPVDLKDM